MTSSAPEGWHTVTPRIVVSDVEELIDFLRHTFGSEGEFRAAMPSEMKIGDSIIMVSGAGVRDTFTAFLYVYVADAELRTDHSCYLAGQRFLTLHRPAPPRYGT